MRRFKKHYREKQQQLNTIDEILEHIKLCSKDEINLDSCQINIPFDFRVILQELKKTPIFTDEISIISDNNQFGIKVFYCVLKIPFRSETTIYKEGAFFELVEFEKYAQFSGAVFESDYSFKKSIFHSSVSFSIVDFEVKKNSEFGMSFFRTIFKKDVSFNGAYFHCSANFRLATFYDDLDIGFAEFSNIDLSDAEMKENAKLINYHKAKFYKVNNRITGLFLKQYALKMNDSVNILLFKKLELDAYRRSLILEIPMMKMPFFVLLSNLGNTFADLFILSLNKWSNSHGNSLFRGILFTLFIWVVFFSWFIINRDGICSSTIWSDGVYLKEAVDYFWLFNGIEGLTKNNTVSWNCIIPFFLGKILIGYGIYQTISAFRKYIK